MWLFREQALLPRCQFLPLIYLWGILWFLRKPCRRLREQSSLPQVITVHLWERALLAKGPVESAHYCREEGTANHPRQTGRSSCPMAQCG